MDYHIKDILKRFVQEDSIRDGYILKKLEAHWEKTMGQTIATRTKQIRFSHGRLMLYITSAPLKQDLMNSRQSIAEKMNALFDEDIIQEVIIL